MSKAIAIVGESGSGKTTSMRNLPPAETFYIDCDGKGLSWKGWRNQYSEKNKNYLKSDNAAEVLEFIKNIDKSIPRIKYVVIDTANGIMVADEMRRCQEKGYDKWVDLAQCIWDLVNSSYDFRDDLTLLYLFHAQTERDENGYSFTRIKTSGKKLDKIVLESKFTTVLLAKVVNGQHIFETHANNSTAKTPLGAFEQDTIENNIMLVLNALADY